MSNATSVHPEEVLNAILAKGNRRDKEEKLRKLYQLCSNEYSRHSQEARDLSIANMARTAESHGLFKARTIYNKQSEDYVALIRAWDAYNGPKASKLIKKQLMPVEKYAFLKKIDDPAIRSLCYMGLIERDKLRVELNMLKSITVVPIDMRPLGAEIAKGSTNVAIIEPVALLTDSERKALTAAIDPKNLAQRKWRLGDTGEVLDDRERFIFNPGFATAVTKILGNSDKRELEINGIKGKKIT